MEKFAIFTKLFSGWSTNRSFWDNFTTIVGTVGLYMLWNRISIFDVSDWFGQLSRNEWSDLIIYFVLWLISVFTGKKFDVKGSGNEDIFTMDEYRKLNPAE